MLKIAALLVSVISFLSATGQPVSDSLLIEGRYRTFHFTQPQTTANNLSLVFILHGSGGTGKEILSRNTRFEQNARIENVLAVYPDGYLKYWNECRKASPFTANQENINDNAFFEAMINYFKMKYKANEKQVFVIGTSGGGHMAYKLAITMPRKIKAIAAIIANLPEITNMNCVESKIPVSVMIINGTKDAVNPYEGGAVDLGNNVNMGHVRSTDSTFQYWAALAGYQGKPVQVNLPDTDPTDGKTIERYTYSQKGKPEVVLLKVIGGKHDYPNDIDVYTESWTFFKRQLSR